MRDETPGVAALDDPELLAERRRVRQELEELAERYRQLDEEFIRRARAVWAHSGQGSS